VDSLVGITCKSPWYAVLVAFQFIWLIGVAAIFGLKLLKRHQVKLQCNYPFHENDVLWDSSKLRFYASVTFVAGIVAGLVGIGGGMVLGPLMLVMNIHPRVSSATTATMVVLTSSSVAIIYVTSGLVPWEYAVFFFSVCFVGAYIGKRYIDAYVKKTGMASVLIGILATIIAFATIGCFIIVLLNLSKADWCFDGFKPFCVVKDKDELNCPDVTTQELSPSEMFPF
jgi:Predicted permeases